MLHVHTRPHELRRCRQLLGVVFLLLRPPPAPAPAKTAGGAVGGGAQPELIIQSGHEGAEANLRAIAFSSDGRLALTAGGADFAAVLWDVADGKQLRAFRGHPLFIHAAALSRDKRFALTGGEDKTARLWDVATGAELWHADTKGTVNFAAFSPDGSLALIGGDGPFVSLRETGTGREVRQFTVGSERVTCAAFSPGGQQVAVGGEGKVFELEVQTGELKRTFSGHAGGITSVSFSGDGRLLQSIGEDGTARQWDVGTGGERYRSAAGTPATFTHDGHFLLLNAPDETTQLLDVSTGKPARAYLRKVGAGVAEFAPDDQTFLAGGEEGLRLIRTATGEELRRLESYTVGSYATAFSRDGRYMATGGFGVAKLWDLKLGRQIRSFDTNHGPVGAVAFAPSGDELLTGDWDGRISVWVIETGEEIIISRQEVGAAVRTLEFSPDGLSILIQTLSRGAYILKRDGYGNILGAKRLPTETLYAYSAAFSPDGKYVLTSNGESEASIWEAETGREVKRLKGHAGLVRAVAFSPDGRYAVTGSYDLTARLWDVQTGREVQKFVGHGSAVAAVAVSPDDKFVLTGSGLMSGEENSARLWEVGTGRELHRLTGHYEGVNTVAFLNGGAIIVTSSQDSLTHFWQAATGRELCRLASLKEDGWAVVTPDGRFDTADLGETRGLHWVFADDPFSPLPLDILIRDYYEPRLLPRLLAGEQLATAKSLAALNRTQPQVEISDISLQKEQGLVSVTVEAADGASGGGAGVYDLRLFRDGQLVASSADLIPSVPAQGGAASQEREEGLQAWRARTRVSLDPRTGKGRLVFRDIRLPRAEDIATTTFSAYAFTSDRVKGRTCKRVFDVPRGLPKLKGRAYIINIGVSSYESQGWDLSYAANDAKRFNELLPKLIEGSGQYQEVVPIQVVSVARGEQRPGGAAPELPTKAAIHAVLGLLAGRASQSDAETRLLRNIPNSDRLQSARPEDLVIVSFSGHGYAGEDGEFYLFPYDIGAQAEREITKSLLEHCISSDELADWLRGIDGGDMVLIIDACHSAAAFESGGYRPGPMGSRGLGQLAYDKGMRILAASQAKDVALESELIKQGLLTYALVQDGVYSRQSEHAVNDLSLKGWLEYGSERVPDLYQEVVNKKEKPAPAGARGATLVGGSSDGVPAFQQPALFDFARKGRDVTLVPGFRANYRREAWEKLRAADAAHADNTAEGWGKAVEGYKEATQWFYEAGDKAGGAAVYDRLGQAYRALGKLDESQKAYQIALFLWQQMGARTEQAATTNRMGELYAAAGDLQGALENYNQALLLRLAEGDFKGGLQTVNRLAALNSGTGETQIAADYLRRALASPYVASYPKEHAEILFSLAAVCTSLAEYQESIGHYTRALSLYKELGDERAAALVMNNLGYAYSESGDNRQAIEDFNQALTFFREKKLPGEEANVLLNLGKAYLEEGKKDAALEQYNQALAVLKTAQDKTRDIKALNYLADLYRRSGDTRKALDNLQAALSLSREVNSRYWEANTLSNLGSVYEALQQQEKALTNYKAALALYETLGERRGQLNAAGGIERVEVKK